MRLMLHQPDHKATSIESSTSLWAVSMLRILPRAEENEPNDARGVETLLETHSVAQLQASFLKPDSGKIHVLTSWRNQLVFPLHVCHTCTISGCRLLDMSSGFTQQIGRCTQTAHRLPKVSEQAPCMAASITCSLNKYILNATTAAYTCIHHRDSELASTLCIG